MSEFSDYVTLTETAMLKRDFARCLAFIKTIPDDQKRRPEDGKATAWTRELWAIKREVRE